MGRKIDKSTVYTYSEVLVSKLLCTKITNFRIFVRFNPCFYRISSLFVTKT